MSEIYLAIQVFLVISLIFFIIRNITKNVHQRKMVVIKIIVVLSLSLIVALSLFVDFKYVESKNIYYYTLGSLAVFLIYFLYALFKTKALPKNIKKKMVYTVKKKNKFIYITYFYDNFIFYPKNKSIIKVKPHEFIDEILKNHTKDFDLKSIELRGIVNIEEKNETDLYYCYLLKFNNKSHFSNFSEIGIFNISKSDLSEFDKFTILKTLMESDFEVEYKKLTKN